jgi:hypothetical protein
LISGRDLRSRNNFFADRDHAGNFAPDRFRVLNL